METDKKLSTLEEELKLLKGELKQSLASVRDYLLNMELPASEYADVLAALGGDGSVQKVTMQGSLANAPPPKEEEALAPEEEVVEPEAELPVEEEELLEENTEPEEEAVLEETEDEPVPDEETDELEEPITPESALPVEEEPTMGYEKTVTEMNPSTPKVNLLANLISWVARAKKEIGYEQISTFLEVYGISGHLSPELKEIILQLAEITSEQPDGAQADLWSQSMLSLHGILTGGDAPRQPVKLAWHDGGKDLKQAEDEALEDKIVEEKEESLKNAPLRLKVVFPDDNGRSQEYCLDLKPEKADNGSQEKSRPKKLK